MTTTTGKKNTNIFLRMHPLQRILLSLFISLITFLIGTTSKLDWVLLIPMLWISFALTFIVTSIIVFCKLPVSEVIKMANQEDGSRTFVFIFIVVSSFASMLSVSLLMLSDKLHTQKSVTVIISILGMVASWVLVHTIFTFHYANMFYSKQSNIQPGSAALLFPGEEKPDYLDFAYFSFVIGMTFQVSDIEIASQDIRRIALVHGLLSFAFNTFVVALTINLIAGLRH